MYPIIKIIIRFIWNSMTEVNVSDRRPCDLRQDRIGEEEIGMMNFCQMKLAKRSGDQVNPLPILDFGFSIVKPKSKKVFSFALCALLLVLGLSAEAQQAQKVPRIGFVSGSGDPSNPAISEKAFRQALGDLGYVNGTNIVVEIRYAKGDRARIPSLVAELVQLKVDVIVTGNLTAVRAAKQATESIPVVMVTNADPVAIGLIDSLARPGRNITGITNLNRDLSAKRLELLKEIVPSLSRVAILWDDTNEGSAIGFKEYETAAFSLKLQLQSLEVRGPKPDLERAFKAAVKVRANALIPIRSAVILRYPSKIADLALSNRLPSIHDGSNYVEAGGLASYSSNDADLFRRAAYFVDRILKGSKPADLPVEQPTKFEFVVNLKTAKQIGLTIPPNVLARADRVIR
jgi:putative ABC transport system substrate-binding protein